MTYSFSGFYYLLVFSLVILVSIFLLKKYKKLPLILPQKGRFFFFNLLQKVIIFSIILLIFLIPFNLWIYQWTKIEKIPTLNIEILFDVSLSMTAKDIKPDRFTAAKTSLVNLIKSLDTNYNIWMVVFSWKPLVYIPFTNSKKALTWKISHMSMADFPPTLDFVWTAIWDAILLGSDQLLKYTHKETKPWVLLLLTDWDSNKWVKVSDAVKFAKYHKIPIFVWAIWKDKSYIVWKTIYWTNVPTTINLKMLKDIALSTSWEYQKIETSEDFVNILSKLASYVKNYEQVKYFNNYLYLNYYFYWLLLILVLVYLITRI